MYNYFRYSVLIFCFAALAGCRQEDPPDPSTNNTGSGSAGSSTTSRNWAGEEYLLDQASDSLSGDSAFSPVYTLQDTLFFLTVDKVKFRGDTLSYIAFSPTMSQNHLIFQVTFPAYGNFRYDNYNMPLNMLPDTISALSGNTPMFHKLRMRRL
ncbi:MAG: hypothetical protein MUC87_10850 [Bacteroidia bacterium]|jgi:hypothetical protein|nr:hypothetical protein [Bacteroidia bacterium]